jgi:hypothetical protein
LLPLAPSPGGGIINVNGPATGEELLMGITRLMNEAMRAVEAKDPAALNSFMSKCTKEELSKIF